MKTTVAVCVLAFILFCGSAQAHSVSGFGQWRDSAIVRTFGEITPEGGLRKVYVDVRDDWNESNDAPVYLQWLLSYAACTAYSTLMVRSDAAGYKNGTYVTIRSVIEFRGYISDAREILGTMFHGHEAACKSLEWFNERYM
jgi:hypothetical protein